MKSKMQPVDSATWNGFMRDNHRGKYRFEHERTVHTEFARYRDRNTGTLIATLTMCWYPVPYCLRAIRNARPLPRKATA